MPHGISTWGASHEMDRRVFFAKGIGAEGEFLLFERFAELEMEQ